MMPKRKPRDRPPRSIVLALMLGLSLATSLALLCLAQLLAAGPVPSRGEPASTGANLAVIRAFYAAANQTLRTGDVAGLTPFVAPDLVEHRTTSGLVAGRGGLVRPLVSVHAGFPTIQLAIDDLLAQADEVVARVHLTGLAPSQFLGLTLSSSLAVWGDVDLFRLIGGVIVEHWDGQANVVELRPLQHAALDLQSVRTVISAVQLTFHPGEAYGAETMRGPRLLYVEAGQLSATITSAQSNSAGQVHSKNGTPGPHELVNRGQTVTLGPGDLLTLPESTLYSAIAHGRDPAICPELAVQLGVPFVTAAIQGPTVQRLADNLPALLPSGSTPVALGEVTLVPGVALPLATSTEATLLVVEAGRLGLTMTAGGSWVQRGTDGTTMPIDWLRGEAQGAPVASSPPGQGTPAPIVFPPATILAPRDTALVGSGASGEIRNTGQTPLALLVVSLTPDHQFVGTPPVAPEEQTRGKR